MSFDLMAFDRTKAPDTYEEFLKWYSTQTAWEEDRDYNSLDGVALKLAAWFMEMKDTFPPMNGPYYPGDENAFATANAEDHLTDYSIGSDVIYGSFAWSVAEEAALISENLARKHDVGFYNPQTGEIYCEGMIACKMRTESNDDKTVVWDQIESAILSLDSPERGISHRDNAFITMFFENNGTDEQFLQCIPDYPKQKGFLKGLFGRQKQPPTILAYDVEAGTGEKIYATKVSSKEELIELLGNYYNSRKLPDISAWEDTGIL